MKILLANTDDFKRIWPLFQEVVSQGDTYGYDPDTDYDEASVLWMDNPRQTYLAEENGQVVGSYYLTSNHEGPGRHVCNCGYMVSPAASGKGIATAMCIHSQKIARSLGYLAMQFNFVAASNKRAVKLWNALGFETVGTLPKAFNHPDKGLVDALVMYKLLE